MKAVVNVTSSLPTLTVFDAMWKAVFRALETASPSESECARRLQQYNFDVVPADIAENQYGCHIERIEHGQMCGIWWQGLQHMQPGSAFGTQPQEMVQLWSWRKLCTPSDMVSGMFF